MKTILKLAKELMELRSEINTIKDALSPIEEKRNAVQLKLIDAMKEVELKSLKTETHNFARTVKKDIKVSDPNLVMDELKKRKLYNEYVKPKLDTISFKAMAKAMLKDTGEVMEGTELSETEYMSIKSIS